MNKSVIARRVFFPSKQSPRGERRLLQGDHENVPKVAASVLVLTDTLRDVSRQSRTGAQSPAWGRLPRTVRCIRRPAGRRQWLCRPEVPVRGSGRRARTIHTRHRGGGEVIRSPAQSSSIPLGPKSGFGGAPRGSSRLPPVSAGRG